MQAEAGYPFTLDWHSAGGSSSNGSTKTLKKDFTFQVRDCFNVTANVKLRYKKPSGGTLCFSLVDPDDPDTTDPRKVYRALEYKPILSTRVPEDLKKMIGTSFQVKKGCEFVEGCFLLTNDKITMYPPPMDDSRLIKKPNTTKVRTSRDDSRSVASEEYSRMSINDSASNKVKFDIGNGFKLTEDDIDKEIEDLFS